MKRALAIVAAALVVVAASYTAVTIFGGTDSEPQPDPQAASSIPALGSAQAGVSTGPVLSEVDRLIGVFESRTAERGDLTDLAFLGRLYLRKATITGEVAVYGQAISVLDDVVAAWTDNTDAAVSLAIARLAVHDFGGALATAESLLDIEPGRVDAIAVVGDANLALGDHDAAAEAFDTLNALLPGHPAVEARLSGVAFLEGDTPRAGALAAAATEHARESGLGGADLAWYQAAQAEGHLAAGRIERAEAGFAEALASDPGFSAALGGLAHVRAVQGRYVEAIDLYEQSTAEVAHPDLLAELGDAYALSGDAESAQAHYDTVVRIGRAGEAVGPAYDRTLLMFYANHDIEPAEALRLAEKEIGQRQDVYAYDALGWALYRNGRLAEAREASGLALALGTPDAEFWYHAGLISAALGENERAIEELERALDLNPYFDPRLSRHATEALAELTGNA